MQKATKQTKTNGNKPKNPSKFKKTNPIVDTKPRAGEKFLNSAEIEKKFNRPNVSKTLMYYFRRIGDEIEGILYPPQNSLEGFRQRIYPIQQAPGDPDSVVFIPGNKHINKLVEKYNLIGKYVRIKLVGKERTGYGHFVKLYSVYTQALNLRERA